MEGLTKLKAKVFLSVARGNVRESGDTRNDTKVNKELAK